ncbi:MAG TPA: DEAD/DEAH box helicase, partial [Coleofasciculaceae cyanobacterium]
QATAAMVAALEAKPKTLRLTGEHAKKLSGTLVGLEDPAAIPAPTIDTEGDQGDGFGSDATPGLLEAYGLTAEDLKTFDGPDGPMLQINESGLQKLAVGYNPEDTEAYDRAIAIKRGDMDEADFVPEGFSHYTAVINSDPLTDAQQFDTSFGLLSQLNTDPANVSDDAILDSVRQFIGARVANGDSALQVQNDILSPSFYAAQGMEPYGEGANRVRELANKLIVDLAGETNDQGSLVIRDQAVRQAFQDLGDREADRYRQVRQTDDLETLRKQTIPDEEIATEALHRTLAAMPMYRTVFTPYEQLSGKEKKWLRNQAITKMMGWDIEAGPAQQRSAVAPTQSQPVYEMGSLFGGPSLTTTQHAAIERVKENLAALDDAWQQRNAPTADDQERHNAKRQALLNQIQQIEAGNLDADEILDEPEDLTQWQLLGKLVGGEDKAIAAVRDMLRGEVLQRFANAYGAISGKPMMIGSEEAAHMDRVELAKLPEAARKEMMDAIKSRQASEIASARNRAAGGQWTKDPDLLAKFEALKGDRRQMSLFTTEETQAGASLKTTRTTLGSTAEAQLHEIAQKVLPNFQQINDPVDIIENVSWGAGTQHATKQRALKFLETQKKAGIHFGAGSGKSSIMLGCFSHLHAQGKVNKMVVAVPSSIVGQFIGESATFLQPGKYNYTANLNMNREDRLKALADPDNHIFVTTRESLANDLLHLVEKHSGVTADQYRELPEDRQKELMLSSAKKEGIDAEKLLLSVDEAHDVTARGNLDPSKRSLALNHLGHHAGYYLQATGDAIKNDLTEMYHFLHSVAPDKFNDQKKFMAEYGQNTAASKRALQRAIAPYSFSASTKPQDRNGRTLKMNEYQPTLDVSDRIAGERQRILDDLSLLSDWQSQRREQLKAEKGDDYRPSTADFNTAWEVPAIREALDRLGSANTWGALDEAGKQQAIGGQIMAIGGLKRTALFRLYHLTPYADNPKMQWTVEHAVDKFKQEGKPGIVFSSSSVAAEEMVRAFEQKGMRVAYIHGGLSSQEKDIERNKFQSKDPQADILICTDAARTGVNLTRGKVLYHYDVPLTEMGYSQRSARIHRLKQDTDTEIYTPTLDTPEEKMALSRMERKGNIAKPIKAKSERLDDTGLARFIREGRSLRRA